MFKEVIIGVIGGLITFVILTLITSQKAKKGEVGELAVQMLKTNEGMEVLFSPQGKALSKTPEFRDFMKALTAQQAERILNLF
jgi:hypothetical protein